MPLGNESRTANILEPMTPRCSTLSNTPLSSNSFAARRYNSIHRRLWVLKEHDGKSQASKFHGTDLYSITLQDTSTPNPIFLMSKALSSQTWLWHRRLSHLNFDSINLLSKDNIVIGLPKLKCVKDYLCSSCELGKAKRKSFHTKTTPSSKRRLQLLHMDLCGPMRVESINGKKYVLFDVLDVNCQMELLKFMSKSSACVTTVDAPNQRQQQHTTPSTSTTVDADTPPLNIQTTPETTSQAPTQAPTITVTENINQAKTNKENAQVEENEFINIFSTP
ncbi:retrovirus-related pol polyprotein from transposon TNT 1-94, partial [Tanacetum coccineum]